ncbi:MAG: VirB8/TrbF family protein [Sphingomicrobium sp.]
MNEQSREALDAYYSEAASWNRDRLRAIRSSQRIAWWVAGAALLVALLEAGALILMMPLKRVEPYTLMVDRTTGYVQALKPLDAERIAPDTALTQSFLVQYVIARESFDMATVNSSYRKVALMSAGAARSSYLRAMQVSNRQSPLVAYPRGTVIETRIKSVSPVGRDVALVRFDTVRADDNGTVQPMMAWVAVIRYRYSGEPMKLEDRVINPLGFQVVNYRRDAEALPQAAAAQGNSTAGGPVAVTSLRTTLPAAPGVAVQVTAPPAPVPASPQAPPRPDQEL